MEKVFFEICSQPLFNFLCENVTGKDFFLNRHNYLENDRYSRPRPVS